MLLFLIIEFKSVGILACTIQKIPALWHFPSSHIRRDTAFRFLKRLKSFLWRSPKRDSLELSLSSVSIGQVRASSSIECFLSRKREVSRSALPSILVPRGFGFGKKHSPVAPTPIWIS